MYRRVAAWVVVAGGLIVPASAGIIFDNGTPDGSNTWFSTLVLEVFQLDDFELQAGANVITDIHWYGAYDGSIPAVEAFALLILDSTLEIAALQLFTTDAVRTTTGIIGQDGLEILEYALFIDPLILDAGVTYWLAIVNVTLETESLWGWSAAGDGSHLQIFDQDISLMDQDLAFRLTNDVIPEPATAGILGLGLVGMAIRFRKRLAK